MKVTNVSICATEAATQAGRPALTPELLAACGARYSRNNEGLDAILSKVDPEHQEKSIDGIFKMIDYGHQSIADIVPVSMFIDEISILQAYLLWAWCPTAGGQESSTRYIKLTSDGLVDPVEAFGLPESQRAEWDDFITKSFQAYTGALDFWEGLVAKNPELAKIPASLLADTSDKAVKQVARMERNYAFDRSRYYLPVAAKTNMMMVMSARGWVQLIQNLLSHWLPECKALGNAIRQELELSAPRLVKHAVEKPSFVSGHKWDLQDWTTWQQDNMEQGDEDYPIESICHPDIEIQRPAGVEESDLVEALQYHDNRYAYIGSSACRTSVRFSWDAVALAEIRDFNRHRTGHKYCPLVPMGFYTAQDQSPNGVPLDLRTMQVPMIGLEKSRAGLCKSDPSYVAWLSLGTQFYFEHTTTLDKFVYEAELRTGTGAHYRYAQHVRDVVAKLETKYPILARAIQLGKAEPE